MDCVVHSTLRHLLDQLYLAPPPRPVPQMDAAARDGGTLQPADYLQLPIASTSSTVRLALAADTLEFVEAGAPAVVSSAKVGWVDGRSLKEK